MAQAPYEVSDEYLYTLDSLIDGVDEHEERPSDMDSLRLTYIPSDLRLSMALSDTADKDTDMACTSNNTQTTEEAETDYTDHALLDIDLANSFDTHRQSDSELTDLSCSGHSEDDSPLLTSGTLPPLSGTLESSGVSIEGELHDELTDQLPFDCIRTSSRRESVHMDANEASNFDADLGRDRFFDELSANVVDTSLSRSDSRGKIDSRKLRASFASYRVSSRKRLDSTAIKQGWLVKKANVVPKWHRRWFTLQSLPEGPVLTYSKDDTGNSPVKTIVLTSTSRCVVPPKPGREHEFRIATSGDASNHEILLAALSAYDLTEWSRAIQTTINAGNASALEGLSDLERIWADRGIRGFLLRYGVRKANSGSRLRTRVLELNFAERTLTNSRRGETITTIPFTDLLSVSKSHHKGLNEEHGIVLHFKSRQRPWQLFLDTHEGRDDLLALMTKILHNKISGCDLEERSPRLVLKTSVLERKNISPDLKHLVLNTTLKGRLLVCLHENCIVFYPEDGDVYTRPWYALSLAGLPISCREDKSLLVLGRIVLGCNSPDECRSWFRAVSYAATLSPGIIESELRKRNRIRKAYQTSVGRLRRLLRANVKPETNGPPKDQKTMELMLKRLWSKAFPTDEYTGNNDPKWLELGFQRGGPASDLRSSGLLGLYCLVYFFEYPSEKFVDILQRRRYGVSEGDMKNYPLAIACINVVAMMSEVLGLGDAGTHSEGCSPNAMKTFTYLVAANVTNNDTDPPKKPAALSTYETWDDLLQDTDNYVFEKMFCLLFPVLDALFVALDAGYMEFGEVVKAFRKRLDEIFSQHPQTMEELEKLAEEPCSNAITTQDKTKRR